MSFQSATFRKPEIRELGIRVLDDEHQAILEHLQTLADLLTDRAGPNHFRFVAKSFDRIEMSMLAHFEHEESMIESTGYTEWERHVAAHRTLFQGVRMLRYRFEQAPHDAYTRDMAQFLCDWWIAHVNYVNTDYVSSVGGPATSRSAG